METTTRTAVQAAPVKIQVIAPEQVIIYLLKICEARHQAYSYYPYATKPDKWEAIQTIRLLLGEAKGCLNWKEQVRCCLRTELAFHCIAYRKSEKSLQNYITKINRVMDACREALNYRKQF